MVYYQRDSSATNGNSRRSERKRSPDPIASGNRKRKKKEELKKDRSPGKIHRWLEKKIIKIQGKDKNCRWKRLIQGKAHQLLDPKNTVGRSSSAVLVREGIQKTYEVRAVVF